MPAPSLLPSGVQSRVPTRGSRVPLAVASAVTIAAMCGCSAEPVAEYRSDSSDPLNAGVFGESDDPEADLGELDELLLVGKDDPRFGLVRTPMSTWVQQEYIRRDALVHEDGSTTEFVMDPDECDPFDLSVWQSGIDMDHSALSGALVDDMLITVVITSETGRYEGLDTLMDHHCRDVAMLPVTHSPEGDEISSDEGDENLPNFISHAEERPSHFHHQPLDVEAPAGVEDFVAVVQTSGDGGVTDDADSVFLRGIVDGIAVDVSGSGVYGGDTQEIRDTATQVFVSQVEKIRADRG